MFDAIQSRDQAKLAVDTLEFTLEELRQEKTYKQQTAINQAIAAAAFGNIEQAKQALEKGGLNDPRPWLKMVEGQESIFNGDSEDGIALLEEAFALAPDDAILQGLLADAYLTGGKWEEFSRLDISKGKVKAENDFEKIFVGNALLWTATERSFRLLDEAVEGTQHPLACIFRARTGALIANIKRDIPLMKLSLKDAEVGEFMLSDNSLAHTHQLTTFLLANNLYSTESGMEKEAQEVLTRAKVSAEKLEEFKDSYDAIYLAGLYFKAVGNETRAMDNFKISGRTALFVEYAFSSKRTADEVKEAIEILSQPPFGHSRSIAYWCILLLDNNREDEANQLIDAYLLKGKINKLGWVIDLALLLGKEKEAKELAELLLLSFQPDDIGVRVDYLRFNAKEMTEESINAYLDTPPLGSHGAKSFQVALRYFASGDRKNALKYFNRCIEQGIVVDAPQYYAQALSDRLEADPTWPHWIKSSGDETE